MRRRTLPPTRHAGQPSPHVAWSAGTVALVSEGRPSAFGESRGERLVLPGYPFQRRRYWIDADAPGNQGPAGKEAWFWEMAARGDGPSLGTALGLEASQVVSLADVPPAIAAWRRAGSWRHRVAQVSGPDGSPQRRLVRATGYSPQPRSPGAHGRRTWRRLG
jgi:acyl transferase domain-containing protein